MRTKQYIVHAGHYYVAGTTVPNGWTTDRSRAHRFDAFIHALPYAERFAGLVEELTQSEHIELIGTRAPQTIHTEDNAAGSGD